MNTEGRSLVKKLKLEKQRIWAQLRKVSRKEGDLTSFKRTLTQVLDKSIKQVDTIDLLVINMTMQ